MKNWKLAALLNTPLGLVTVLGSLVLAVELLIMEVIHDVLVPMIFPEVYWGFIDTALLTIIVSPALYFLVFRKMHESEQHFRAVTESANDAIITAAGAGNIVGWNAAAGRVFGYTEAEIIGQPLTVLIPERFRNQHSAGLARVVAGGAPHVIGKTVELAGLHKDGSEFPLEFSLAQWQSAKGQFFTAIIRDITEHKLAEAKLAEQIDELRRWHDATSGREKRILVIKHEVNELLAQAGQPPRYPSAESQDQTEE